MLMASQHIAKGSIVVLGPTDVVCGSWSGWNYLRVLHGWFEEEGLQCNITGNTFYNSGRPSKPIFVPFSHEHLYPVEHIMKTPNGKIYFDPDFSDRLPKRGSLSTHCYVGVTDKEGEVNMKQRTCYVYQGLFQKVLAPCFVASRNIQPGESLRVHENVDEEFIMYSSTN